MDCEEGCFIGHASFVQKLRRHFITLDAESVLFGETGLQANRDVAVGFCSCLYSKSVLIFNELIAQLERALTIDDTHVEV